MLDVSSKTTSVIIPFLTIFISEGARISLISIHSLVLVCTASLARRGTNRNQNEAVESQRSTSGRQAEIRLVDRGGKHGREHQGRTGSHGRRSPELQARWKRFHDAGILVAPRRARVMRGDDSGPRRKRGCDSGAIDQGQDGVAT